jgi:uncharacterized protein GlcG (DUF336 family)
MKLAVAQTILAAALEHCVKHAFKPCVIVVLDARGAPVVLAAQDGTSLHRADIARGKAYGAVALGQGSRTSDKVARERPHFMAAVTHAVGGTLVPVPGGVLIRDEADQIVGAVGISGDTSDNDEAAAVAGILAAGLKADPGAA